MNCDLRKLELLTHFLGKFQYKCQLHIPYSNVNAQCSAWLLHTLLRVLDQAPSDMLEALRNDCNGLGVR